MRRLFTFAGTILLFCLPLTAQITDLSFRDFAYVGEWDTRHPDKQSLYLFRDGRQVLEYSIPMHDEFGRIQEFDDVRVLPDGNIVYAAMSQLGIIDGDGRQVWKYVCPQGTESHSCQPYGPDMVYFALNGVPGKIVIWNTREDRLVREIVVPTEGKSTHGQFRHVRRTAEGTFVTGLIHENKVVEIDTNGVVLKEIPGVKAWHVDKLGNGGYLVAGDNRGYVREYDSDCRLVWELTQDDVPFALYNLQTATRLPNGDTVITNWVAGKDKSLWPGSVQFFEVTPDKRVVWKVSSWDKPDLGPCTYLDFYNLSPRLSDGRPRMTNCVEGRPIGVGKGIHPGRVAWIHCPGVAKWDGQTGIWSDPEWNDQAKAERMVRRGVVSLTGEKNARKAWKALFVNFNETHGKGRCGYRKGERIAVKLNMNNSFGYADNEELNSSPYITLALLRSLVYDAGVPQECISVCEPSRYLTDRLYYTCKSEFPDVNYVDNVGGEGRTKCEFYDNTIPFTPGRGERQKGLAKCIVDADYVINSALLKIHTGPGVTLTGKNWYGATSLDKEWRKNSHNAVSQDKRFGVPKYSSFVDFIGHRDLGGKCLLYLIDGTYGSRDVNGKPSPKWLKEPFCGDWACSLIMSQDPLAGDSVGLDLLAYEWPEVPSLPYCDLYLVEAASLPAPPSGITYDPEADGRPLDAPLGLTEHWNSEHRYTGIDLVYVNME